MGCFTSCAYPPRSWFENSFPIVVESRFALPLLHGVRWIKAVHLANGTFPFDRLQLELEFLVVVFRLLPTVLQILLGDTAPQELHEQVRAGLRALPEEHGRIGLDDVQVLGVLHARHGDVSAQAAFSSGRLVELASVAVGSVERGTGQGIRENKQAQ